MWGTKEKLKKLGISTQNQKQLGKNKELILKEGYPAYLTCGWSGYSNEKIKIILNKSLKKGIKGFKMKVGNNIIEDCNRAAFIRSIIGDDVMLSMDANGVWSKKKAIENMLILKEYKPYWIEEPTHPDDILAHKEILEKIYPINVATGEQCSNKVMFKQFLQEKAITILQTDIQRLAGINEWLVVMLMCRKFGTKFCVHSGGVGLTNMGAHLSIINAICINPRIKGCFAEYVEDLSDHFEHPIELINGNYFPPKVKGFGLEIKEKSIEEYKFPNGLYWIKNPDIIEDKGWYS